MRTVITYGTFDLFHQGHYNILKRAKEEGDYLIVGVTGETYDVERGKLSVQDSLATRIENVKKTGFADKIIVEEYLGQKIPDILKYHVDVFVVGSDWKGKFDHIGKYCEIKYLERTKNISSTQIRQENLNIYRFGIVTDEIYDNDAVIEPKIVSGIHVESVFAEDPALAKEFQEKYELNGGYSDYDEFLAGTDIAYVKTKRESRCEYVERAIKAGVHVITDMPFTLDTAKERELQKLADEKGVLVLGNVLTLYQHAFGQMLWMARGNMIGDLISVKCSISKKAFDEKCNFDFVDFAYFTSCAIMKILGCDIEDCHTKMVRNENGEINYGLIEFSYKNSVAVAEISMDVEQECSMTILGTEGVLVVPEDWWRMGYFKYKNKSEARAKHYSSNFEGNGFRYLIQTMVQELRTDKGETERITLEESAAVHSILSTILEEQA